MKYQSLKLLLNCIMRSDILFACLGEVVSFIYRHLFPCYLTKGTVFFQYYNLEYMIPKMLRKVLFEVLP